MVGWSQYRADVVAALLTAEIFGIDLEVFRQLRAIILS